MTIYPVFIERWSDRRVTVYTATPVKGVVYGERSSSGGDGVRRDVVLCSSEVVDPQRDRPSSSPMAVTDSIARALVGDRSPEHDPALSMRPAPSTVTPLRTALDAL